MQVAAKESSKTKFAKDLLAIHSDLFDLETEGFVALAAKSTEELVCLAEEEGKAIAVALLLMSGEERAAAMEAAQAGATMASLAIEITSAVSRMTH